MSLVIKVALCLLLAIWLFAGVIIGVGGLTKLSSDETLEKLDRNKSDLIKKTFPAIKTEKGATIGDEYTLAVYNEQQGLETYFKWTVILPQFTAEIITAMSFGLPGALVNVLKDLAIKRKSLLEVSCITMPILGLLTGIVVLGLSYLLPTVLTKDAGEIRPMTLMFLCLFCGISTQKFYDKIESFFDKLFTKQ
ncbi:MAG: hypothetical protein JWP45_58 [Mucilaginibacter sp.]|nr:hypothetical protein [Mucilaginibacter sp.]